MSKLNIKTKSIDRDRLTAYMLAHNRPTTYLLTVSTSFSTMAVTEFAMKMSASLSFHADLGVRLIGEIVNESGDTARGMTDWELNLVAIPIPEFKLTSAFFWSDDDNEVSPAAKFKASNGEFITVRDLINAITAQENEILTPTEEEMEEYLGTGIAEWIGDHRYYEGLRYNEERNTYEVNWGS